MIIKIIKNILLNLPIILGLMTLDLITPNVLGAFTDSGNSLKISQIIIALIRPVLKPYLLPTYEKGL